MTRQQLIGGWVILATWILSSGASAVTPAIVPLGLQTAVSATGQAAQSSADPLVLDVAGALRRTAGALAARRMSTVRPTVPQRDALSALVGRMGAAIDVHLRAPNGTPRMVRGTCLERAHGSIGVQEQGLPVRK